MTREDEVERAEQLVSAWMNKWNRSLVSNEYPDLVNRIAAALKDEKK